MIAVIGDPREGVSVTGKRLEKLQVPYIETCDPDEIRHASGMILSCSGNFGQNMRFLSQHRLTQVIKEEAVKGKPLLGINLGMQLLFTSSDEHGYHQGLNLLAGHVTPYKGKDYDLHLGWHRLRFTQMDPLTWGLEEQDVYFAHRFAVQVANQEDLLGITDGEPPVVAIVGRNNIYGIQFCVAKSGPLGLQLLQQFVNQCKLRTGV